MELTSVLSSAKTAFELARALQSGLAKGQIKPEEVPARLLELQQHILTMQSVVHDLAEENRQLREKLAVNDTFKALDADMDFQLDGGFYVRKSEADKGLIAYCPICWKGDGKTIPMENNGRGCFRCAVHKKNFETANGKEYTNSIRRGAFMR